jgi:hypothetical protein
MVFAGPTRDGYWQWFGIGKGGWGGGCPWRARGVGRRHLPLCGGGISSAGHIYSAVSGSTLAAPGARAFVVYADRSRQRIKVVWVSSPITAGFYSYVIPRSHRTPSRRVIAVEIRRGTRVLARQDLRVPAALARH